MPLTSTRTVTIVSRFFIFRFVERVVRFEQALRLYNLSSWTCAHNLYYTGLKFRFKLLLVYHAFAASNHSARSAALNSRNILVDRKRRSGHCVVTVDVRYWVWGRHGHWSPAYYLILFRRNQRHRLPGRPCEPVNEFNALLIGGRCNTLNCKWLAWSKLRRCVCSDRSKIVGSLPTIFHNQAIRIVQLPPSGTVHVLGLGMALKL